MTADREREAQNPAHQELHTQSSEIQANHLRITSDKLKQRSDKLLGVGDSSSRDLVGGLTPKRAASFFICGPTPGASLPRPPSRAFQGGAAGGLPSQPHPYSTAAPSGQGSYSNTGDVSATLVLFPKYTPALTAWCLLTKTASKRKTKS